LLAPEPIDTTFDNRCYTISSASLRDLVSQISISSRTFSSCPNHSFELHLVAQLRADPDSTLRIGSCWLDPESNLHKAIAHRSLMLLRYVATYRVYPSIPSQVRVKSCPSTGQNLPLNLAPPRHQIYLPVLAGPGRDNLDLDQMAQPGSTPRSTWDDPQDRDPGQSWADPWDPPGS